MTDQYAELHAEIARLRGDPDFERDVADKPRAFGPPPGPDVVDDSGYFTALRVDALLAAASSARSPIRTALGIGPDAGDE